MFLLALVLVSASLPAASAPARLTLQDVEQIFAQAITRASQVSPNSIIAVADREGYVLGVWSVNGATPAPTVFPNPVGNAISKAISGAFLSSAENAFTSRTAGFIVQQNFPPGVDNRSPGPLVGVNFSNLGFSDINRAKSVTGYNPALVNGTNGNPVPVPITGGLGGAPGGLPLYKEGQLVGGIGVAGDGDTEADITPETIANPDIDEDVALAGQIGFAPGARIIGSTIDGVRVPYVQSTTSLGAVQPLGSIGVPLADFPLTNGPGPINYPAIALGGVVGELRSPIIDDLSAVLLPDGSNNRLTATEVTNILAAAANRARTTRAGIRLPRGRPMQVFISVVSNPNQDGEPPVVLGTLCTSPDTTRFSWDVSVQKARTAVFFSNTTRAHSCRTVGFLSESTYPPGIKNTEPGIYYGLQERFSLFPPGVENPLNGVITSTPAVINPNLPNGITIFPGGFPIYKNGVLVGAIGVSGDGVDQDDIVAATGASLFPPPNAIRADRTQYRGARLPFAKFPRNPAL